VKRLIPRRPFLTTRTLFEVPLRAAVAGLPALLSSLILRLVAGSELPAAQLPLIGLVKSEEFMQRSTII
jgi:hypothetical protein